MEMILANNATSLLALGIDEQETTIQLKAGDGSKFPTLTAGQFFPVTLVAPDREIEIVYVTARTGDTLTVLRGQEGTAQRAFPAGSVVELRLTAGLLGRFAQLGRDAAFSRLGVQDWDLARGPTGNLELRGGEPFAYFIMQPDGLPMFYKLPVSSGRTFDAFPNGTRMLFQQSVAPIDWVKVTDHNDKALRVVSGNVSSGGAIAFSAAFANRPITHANLPNVTLTGGTDWAGDHAHTYTYYHGPDRSGGSGGQYHASNAQQGWTSTAGGHSHSVSVPLGGSDVPLDFRVQYVDVIIAEKAA